VAAVTIMMLLMPKRWTRKRKSWWRQWTANQYCY